MNKLLSFLSICSVALVLDSCSSCNSSSVSSDEEETSIEIQKIDSLLDELEKDTTKQVKVVELEKPEVKEETKKIIDERTNNSKYNSHECCNLAFDEIDDCCCKLVLLDYQKLMEENPQEAAKDSRVDPILIKCKKDPKFKTLFEEIDYGDDDEDDLGL